MNEKGSRSGIQIRLVFLIIIGAAVVIVAVQNRQPVQTRFLVFQATMPRFALLLLTAGCGFVAGYLLGMRRRR